MAGVFFNYLWLKYSVDKNTQPASLEAVFVEEQHPKFILPTPLFKTWFLSVPAPIARMDL